MSIKRTNIEHVGIPNTYNSFIVSKDQPVTEKDIWVVWTNAELPGGKRGEEIPFILCWSQTTAIRIGKHHSIWGPSCRISKEKTYFLNNNWYAPVNIIHPSKEDIKADKKNDEYYQAVNKAKEVGLTETDITILASGEK